MESNRREKGDEAGSTDKVIQCQWRVASDTEEKVEKTDTDLIKSVGAETELS